MLLFFVAFIVAVDNKILLNSLNFFQPALILAVAAASQSPLEATLFPKYRKECTVSKPWHKDFTSC